LFKSAIFIESNPIQPGVSPARSISGEQMSGEQMSGEQISGEQISGEQK
jgi:hypothetical protein